MQDNPHFEAILAHSDLFSGLSQETIRKILPLCSVQTYEQGNRIFRQGERLDHLYIIASGQVALARATRPHDPLTEIPVHTLEAKQCMAWSSLIAEPTATMSALVMENAEVLAITASPFRSLLEQDHDFAHSVLRRMLELLTDRLRRSYAFLDTVV